MIDYDKLIREDDPYERLVRNDQAQALRGAMAGAVMTQPDVEAKLVQLSRQVGVPLDTVRLDARQAERSAALGSIDYDRMVRETPVTAGFLADRAAVARDDVGPLTRIERAFTAFGQGVQKGSLQDELGPLHYRAMTGKITPAEQARRKELADQMKALDTRPEKGDSPLSWFFNVTGYSARQMVTSIREGGTGAVAGAAAGAGAAAVAGQLGPQVAVPEEIVTVPGAALLGARAGFITASTVFSYKMESGFAYDEFEQLKTVDGKPMPRDVAQGAAAAVGLINAALDTVGDIALLKLVPGIDRLLSFGPKEAVKALLQRPTFRAAIAEAGKKWAKAASIEGVTEGIQEIVVILGRELAEGAAPGRFPDQPPGRDVERVLQSTAEGAAGAAGVGAPMAGYRAGVNIREAQIAQRNQDFMTALGDGAQASKLRERLPEVFREFVERARQSGPVENVYIPADQFARYWQSQGADPAAAAAQVGAVNFPEAMAAGTDVVIPLADYAAKMAATQHHAALMQDVKLHQGDLTMREAQAQEQRQKELQAELEAMIDREAGTAQTPAVEQIKQEAMGELVGRFERSTADAYATTYARTIANLAQRAGIDPLELHRTYGLRVVTPLPEVLRSQPNIDTALDPMLDRLRAGDIPSESAALGPSLFEFIRDRGGLQPVAETKFMDENVERRAFQRKITQPRGMDLDTAMEAAVEAGYFTPEPGETLGATELLDALGQDVTGARVFSPQFRDEAAAGMRDQLLALQAYIEQLGGDLNMDNATLKALILRAAEQQGGEDAQQFDQGEGALLFQSAPPLGEGEVKRVLRREPGNFTPEEQEAFDRFMATRPDKDRILANLELHKGTPWAKQAVEGIFTREAMRLLIAGEQPPFQSSMDSGQVARTRKVLQERGLAGLWQLIEADGGLMGAAAKPVNNVNSSFINCDPSKDCAQYCYATKGNYQYANVIVKSELVTLAVELEPVRSAQRVAQEYKATAEFMAGKALRLFDKGDGNAAWLPFIVELNRQGIRTQIFSKVPEFLRQVPDMNLRLLSIDESNMEMADANQDLPVAFVYTGKHQIDMLAKMAARNQVQVVLPVKLGQKLLDGSEITDLKKSVPEIKPYLCPIDAGFKKLGKTSQPGTWNCTKCDVNGGVGCFHGTATKAVMESLEAKANTPTTQQERAQRILELRSEINAILAGAAGNVAEPGRVPPGRVEGLLRQVDALMGELLRDYDAGPESGAAVAIGSGSVAPGGSAEGAVPGRGGAAAPAGDGRRVIPIRRLYQSETPDDKRGFIQIAPDRKITIGLLEKADLSTFLHETGHFWLEVLGDLSERADAAQQIKDDYQTLLNWFGVKSRAEITTEHHERFARANEAYLMEGKAPSPELRSIFQRFRAWLNLIYRTMSRLNVELTPQVRGVFDRIYATDEEIEAAQRQLDARPLFATAADAGMTEGEFAAYRKTVEAASEAAKEKLQAELMREYQRERERWWKDKRAEVRLEVEAEIDATPVYQAFAALVEGKLPDGTAIKLDKADLVRRYGEEYLKRLPRGFQRVYAAEGGADIDTAAEALGFGSGKELIEALVNMRPRKDLIDAETDTRMAREYGDMRLDGTIADEAMQAVHNEQRAKVIEAELRALRRQQRIVQPVLAALSREERQARQTALDIPPAAVFRAAAAGRIGQMQVKDISPQQYLLAERRASRAAYEAAARKDYVTAATEKQRELMNHYLYLEAVKARQEIDKVYAYMGRFEKAATREKLAKAGADYLDQIDAILERYEFRRVSLAALAKRQSLTDFVEEMESQGLLVNIPDALLDEARRVNYRQATVDELRAVRDTVRNIEHLATLKNKLLRKREAIEFAAVKAELIESARDNFNPTGELSRPNRKGETVRDKGARLWKWFDAKHLKVEQLVEWLDGGKIDGPWARFLFDQAADAQTREYELHAMVTAKLSELSDSMPKTWRQSLADKTAITLPGIDGPVTRYTLLSLALNTGNASNLQRLRDGYGWSDDLIRSALAELNADDARFVQGVWDTVNSLWPEIVALEKRVTGVAPPKVEAIPVTIGGVEVSGGYFPLVYDSRLSAVGEKQAEATESVGQFLANAYGRARTDKGYTKQRVETLKAPVLLDFEQVLTSHLTRVIKDVSHREAIYSLNKILKDGDIKAALIDTVGEEQYRELNRWVQVLVADRADTLHQATGAAKLIMQFRTNMAIVTMGWRISTMLAQFAGIGPAMDLVKPRYLTQALVDFNRYGPWSSHRETLTQMVYEKSGEMRFRADTIERDVRDSLRRLQGDNSPLAAVRKSAFYLTAMADRQITIPTWLGAYRQGLAEGLTEEAAVRAGDRAVRLSQGAGGTKDLAAVQRDNELMRLLTMYYSPFSVLYARLRDLGHTTRRVQDMPRAVARVLALVILPAVLGDLLAAKGPGEDEDDVWWAIRKSLLYPVASIPVVRDLSGYLEARLIAIAGDGEMKFAPSFSLSPVVGAMDKLARLVFMRIPEAAQGQRPWDDVAWDTLEASGYVLGLPTAQVRITGEYITDVLTDQARPESPQQALHDLLFRRQQP